MFGREKLLKLSSGWEEENDLVREAIG